MTPYIEYPGRPDPRLDSLMQAILDERPRAGVDAFLKSDPGPNTLLAACLGAARFHRTVALTPAIDRYTKKRLLRGFSGIAETSLMLEAVTFLKDKNWADNLIRRIGTPQDEFSVRAIVRSHTRLGKQQEAIKILNDFAFLLPPVAKKVLKGEALKSLALHADLVKELEDSLDIPEAVLMIISSSVYEANKEDMTEYGKYLQTVPRVFRKRYLLQGKLLAVNPRPLGNLLNVIESFSWATRTASFDRLGLRLDELSREY